MSNLEAGAHDFGEAIAPLHVIHPAVIAIRRPRNPVGGRLKRGFDVLVATIALGTLALPLLVVAAAIKLDSPGPVFFLQRRGGFRGRPFLVFKFRTMTSADDGRDICQARQVDARVTRVGAFLRKTSIDELPQLLNVLRGEMSIVGPRPHAVAHDAEFCRVDRRYRRRFKARPGITGLAQVSGCRGLIGADDELRRRVGLDLDYIDGWSMKLDLRIIVRTASIVLRDPNAH